MKAKLIHRRLKEHGMILESDRVFPNVVTLITGEVPRGSWWKHPRGNEIYVVLDALANHPNVLFVKLLSGKVTLIHRRLWPHILTIGTSRESWQTTGLFAPAKILLREVETKGSILATGKAPVELEKRLLIHAAQVHTETGVHHKRLETWKRWRRRARPGKKLPLKRAKRELEEIVASLNDAHGARVSLPWVKR